MSGKKIYSNELKLEIVERYLRGGISIRLLAEEYSVCASEIKKWRNAYSYHGVAGLCTTHGTYSGDFKLSVIEYMHSTGASLNHVAAYFNIPSKRSISSWERIYYEEGKEALFEERRGRASKMNAKRSKKSKKKIETNEDLLAEVQRLRMENEYLKKLNALVQKREESRNPTK